MRKNGEILIAWARGKDVQYQYSGSEVWHDWDRDSIPPPCIDNERWRIKPAPKPDVNRYCRVSLGEFQSFLEMSEELPADSNVRFVFSGETGELIKAEVLK